MLQLFGLIILKINDRIVTDMPNIYFLKILLSNFCKLVFVAAFFLGYFLIPRSVFDHSYRILALIFMLTFALSITCITRNIKERIALMKTTKSSVLTIVASIFGLAAFQVCGVGTPVCGVSVGVGFVSIIFPGFLYNLLTDYANGFIIFSIFAQIIALYFMHCFHPAKSKKKS